MKHIIKMPVLRAKIVILIGDEKYARKRSPKGIDPYVYSDRSEYMARCNLFKVDSKKHMINEIVIHSHSAALSVIAHEAVHAAAFILEAGGIDMRNDHGELSAYIVQHICEEVEGALYGSTKG